MAGFGLGSRVRCGGFVVKTVSIQKTYVKGLAALPGASIDSFLSRPLSNCSRIFFCASASA